MQMWLCFIDFSSEKTLTEGEAGNSTCGPGYTLSHLANPVASSVKTVWTESCNFPRDSCKFHAEEKWLLKMLILPVTLHKWRISSPHIVFLEYSVVQQEENFVTI